MPELTETDKKWLDNAINNIKCTCADASQIGAVTILFIHCKFINNLNLKQRNNEQAKIQ